ncbi:MAG: DUF1638 domain-containing protein [Lentisphaeria bacterium]|nr:DUF1638 domain-containing protein [Lentisphaeria bacterium]
MLFKLIACNVFTREACIAVAESPHTIDLEFTEIGEHSAPDHLRDKLQQLITQAENCGKRYDAILLLFGLCGNATLDLHTEKFPLVIPRAHDCCTILLGSKQAFTTYFKEHPSTPFSSVGYMERGEYFLRTADDQSEAGMEDPFAAYVEQYGEENARYIWDTLHPGAREESAKAYFIDIPETHALADIDGFKKKVEDRGLEFSILEGRLTLIRQLIQGDWKTSDFLVIEPGQRIAAVYDWDDVLRAMPNEC